MNKKKIYFVSLIFIVLIGLSSYFFSSGSKGIDKNEIKFNTLKIVVPGKNDYRILIDLAKNKGFFKKNGVNIEIVSLSAGVDNLMMAGAVDAKLGGLTNSLAMYLNNQDPVLLGSLYRQNDYGYLSIYPRSEFNKIKNVCIGTGVGNEGYYMVMIALKNLGIDYKKINPIIISNEKVKIEMLNQRKIDFTNISDYKILNDNSSKFTYVSSDEHNLLKNYYSAFNIITTRKVLKNKKADLGKFVKSLYETLDYIKNNKVETIKYFKEKYKLNEKESELYYSKIVKGMNEVSRIPKMNTIEKMKDIILEFNKVKNPGRDLKDFVYPDFVNNFSNQNEAL